MISAKTSLNRAALKGGVATFVLAMLANPVAGLAQTTAAAVAAADDEGTIVVTGSLIKNPNLVSAAPVTVTTAGDIQLKASNVAEEVLRDIPGIVPSVGSAVNNGNAGSSYVDLRGLGSNRNIVLLDGSRLVPADLQGRVDLNNIPLALIERVDALTGAAVTTYGADAITGVVNFVTKQNFTGVDLQLSNGLTERGDGQRFRADLTVGGNFADGKGNAVVSIGYQKADPVYQGDRDFSLFTIDSNTGGEGGSGTTVPSRLSGTRPFSGNAINTTPLFSATGASVPNPSFDPTKPVSATNPTTRPLFAANAGGAANNGTSQIDPATGRAVPTYSFFNFNPYNVFQTPFERFNLFAQAKYDVSDALEFYTRGLFSKNTVQQIIAPSGDFGATVTVPLSNPFLPAALRNQFCARNVAPVVDGVGPDGKAVSSQVVYTPLLTQAQCDAAALATSPTDPNYKTVDTALFRRTTELGPRTSTFTTTVFDYRAGLRGKITDSVNWDLQGSYGQSENRQTIGGYVQTSKLRQSILSTNTTSCLDPSNGCIPINVFGPAGSIDPAAGTFVLTESTTAIKTSLVQVRGLVNGDIGIALPTATDAIGFALGAEYRKYTASQESDSIAQQAGQLGGGGAATIPFKGGYDVKEVYGELIAPLVQDKPFFQNLTLETGARYSSYKVDAANSPSYDAFTWKAGGTWEIAGGFKLRGNYSRATRAPNINELFAPQVVGLTSLTIDPCAGAAPTTNATLRAVCIAQGAPVGSIGNITNPSAAQANATTSGNLNIKPEKATTWTIGGVYQPTFLPGASLTVDYYKIVVKDAITAPTSGDAINACFANLTAASATSPACLGIVRNPTTGGVDGDPATTPGLNLPLTNLGKLQTRGLDVTANYTRDIGFAKLGLQFNANWTFSQKFQSVSQTTAQFTALGIERECVGYYSANCGYGAATGGGSLQPKFQSSLRTTFGFDFVDVSGVWRHLSSMQQEPLDAAVNPFFPGFDRIKAYDTFDLSGRFHVTKVVTLILTVNNMFDRNPPIVGGSAGNTLFNSGNTYPSTYDALGRRYTAQLGVRF